MELKKRITTFLLDLILIFSVILTAVFARKKLEYYIISLRNFSPKILNLGAKLSFQNLTTYNQTYAEQVISQTNSLIFHANFYLFLIPLAIILFYLITQSINWKLINNTKINKFVIISVPFLIVALLFLNSLLDSALLMLYDTPIKILFTVLLFLIFLLVSYISLVYYSKKKIKNPKTFLKKSVKKLIFPFSLILINWFLILINSLLIYIFFIMEQSIIPLIPPLIIFLIIGNFQRTSFVKKIKTL